MTPVDFNKHLKYLSTISSGMIIDSSRRDEMKEMSTIMRWEKYLGGKNCGVVMRGVSNFKSKGCKG